MAIGRLGSFKTSTTVGLNTNTALYTSTGTLSKVTINVTNQGVEDATFSIGISSGTAFRDSDFIVFGQTIKRGTYASITNIAVCSGETIFARSNEADVSFVVHSVLDYDASIGSLFGRQESVRTSLSGPAPVNNPVVLYTAPRAAQVSISINNTSQDDATYSIGISSGGLAQFTSADYIIFGQSLPKRTTQIIDSIGIGTGQSIIVKANEPDVTFVAYDLPTSILEKTGSDAISIASSVTARGGFYGNLVGNVFSAGISTFDNGGVVIGAAGTDVVVNSNSSFDAVRITQLGSGNALVVEDESTQDKTPFVVNASGSVGVGTTNATSKFNVFGDSNLRGSLSIDGYLNPTDPYAFRVFNSISNQNAIVVASQSYYTSYSRQLSPQVGTAITTSAVGAGCTRCTDALIYNYFWDNYNAFDVDGDGVVSPNDALVIIRYLFGDSFAGDALISGITFPATATRTTANALRSFIGIHSTTTYDLDGNGSVPPLGDGLMINRIVTGGFTNPSDAAPARFVSNFNVGVGTTSATSKLTVTGDTLVSGAITATNLTVSNTISGPTIDQLNSNSTLNSVVYSIVFGS